MTTPTPTYTPVTTGFANASLAVGYALGAGFRVREPLGPITRAERDDVPRSYRLILADDDLFYWEVEA